jgi:uncharacterized protein (DUF1697 family)
MGRAVEFPDAVNKKISISNGKKITVIGETCSRYERKFDGDKVKRLKAQTSDNISRLQVTLPQTWHATCKNWRCVRQLQRLTGVFLKNVRPIHRVARR